jgi:hypothetical protein
VREKLNFNSENQAFYRGFFAKQLILYFGSKKPFFDELIGFFLGEILLNFSFVFCQTNFFDFGSNSTSSGC